MQYLTPRALRSALWFTLAIAFLPFTTACATSAHRSQSPVMQLELQSTDEAVGLRHYHGAGERVLVVGNPGISPLLFDIPGYGGLAPYLQNAGYDVWVLDWKDLAKKSGLADLSRWAGHAIRHVGRDEGVTVVAHGLGGVAVVMSEAADHVNRYVFLATPGNLGKPLEPVAALHEHEWTQAHTLSDVRPALADHSTGNVLEALLWNFGTLPVDAEKLTRLFTPVGPALLNELAVAVGRGGWGKGFEGNLADIGVPVTVLVGQTDAVAPPWQSYAVYENVGTETRFYRFFSRALGERREYGHLSMIVGDDAVREVYPFILRGVQLEAGD